MYFDYVNVIVFFLVGALFVLATMIFGALIRPKNPNPIKAIPYECGEDPVGDARVRFDIRYYTIALIYIIFAVEVAFLFPWAVIMGDALTEEKIGSFALWEGVIFTVILFLGLIYVWAKGDLGWIKEVGVERPPRSTGLGKPVPRRKVMARPSKGSASKSGAAGGAPAGEQEAPGKPQGGTTKK